MPETTTTVTETNTSGDRVSVKIVADSRLAAVKAANAYYSRFPYDDYYTTGGAVAYPYEDGKWVTYLTRQRGLR